MDYLQLGPDIPSVDQGHAGASINQTNKTVIRNMPKMHCMVCMDSFIPTEFQLLPYVYCHCDVCFSDSNYPKDFAS